ncbi:hypothetical protein IHV10_22295 [Fictibacillus sp. 5RED26]|uniref:DUF5362 family protein n=1 Tax=Fictibacillus sp. 5RED26 TaxID=2745876 RepID=UPI0018CE6712|nr:DUF5362 family protein [Fictibacillus sp. 5RED26]MBH0159104.1 hypothetical protein [Fictibacillus sp. 5RED26]
MFKEGKYKSQRQPKRHLLTTTGAFLILGGFLISLTIIGAILGIPMILVGISILFLKSRIKVKTIECNLCKNINKVELKVERFNCEHCNKTLLQDYGEWIEI